MPLALIDQDPVRFLEGAPNETFMTEARDVDRLIEACWSEGVDAVLLHADNLPPGFFDLSSGDAGTILQKTRIYGIRLGVLAPPGAVTFSSSFGSMVAEEERGSSFAVFARREDAYEWLQRHAE